MIQAGSEGRLILTDKCSTGTAEKKYAAAVTGASTIHVRQLHRHGLRIFACIPHPCPEKITEEIIRTMWLIGNLIFGQFLNQFADRLDMSSSPADISGHSFSKNRELLAMSRCAPS